MLNYLCVSVTFLDPVPAFHGRGDAGEPEWPPSRLRVFQALVAAAASRWREAQFQEHARPALEWLQRRDASIIVAPSHHVGVPVRIAVPNNDLDVVATAWSKRREPKKQPNELKTMKTVRPTRLLVNKDDPATVHYLFPLADGGCPHLELLAAAARSITHLGWGVDMVAGHASVISEEAAAKLAGERWQPTEDPTAPGYRVPMSGTLDALIAKHEAFLTRLGPDGFHPVPPLAAFRMVGYRRATDPPQRPFAAFSLLKPDASGFRSFDAARNGMVVAGMMRHAAENVGQSLGWPPERIAAFILGHAEPHGQPYMPVPGPRLAYIPLPSIESRGEGRAQVVGRIRRAMIAVGGGQAEDELQQLAPLLSGADLIKEGSDESVALLSRIPNSDRMVRRYSDPAPTWATVTPVVLPGYDDPNHYRQRLKKGVDSVQQKRLLGRLNRRAEKLLRDSIAQAGYADQLARDAVIEWRPTGFLPGGDLASRYEVPKHLKRFPRLHVRITWRDAQGQPIKIPGPVCLGGGRYCGLGLFVAEEADA